MLFRGNFMPLTGNASDALQLITTGITALRVNGSKSV